jgi:glyoxylase-like metal-dependent hydrolase (beta-lactamase superfamily II)
MTAGDETTNGPVRLRVGAAALTRVPYFDIPLDPAVVGLTADDVRAIPWAAPVWATADGNVRIGQAIWVIESDGEVVVVDPCGAADDFLRTGDGAVLHQARVADAMNDAGYPVARVDRLVLTHLDGIGMAAAVSPDGEWVPMFPNARIVMTQAEVEYLAGDPEVSGLEAFRSLLRHGVVDGVAARHDVAPGVRMQQTGGHTPGHAVVRIAGEDRDAVFLGHLAVNPVQFAAVQGPQAHLDSPHANRVVAELVDESATAGTILVGSLWPAPGAATIGPDGEVVPIPVG